MHHEQPHSSSKRMVNRYVGDYFTLYKTNPFKPLLAASCISTTSLSPEDFKNIDSAGCNALINLTGNPEAKALTSSVVKFTFLPGLEINEISLTTGWLLRYFNPNHNLLVAMLSGVTSTGFKSGPLVDPFWISEINPSLYKPRATSKWRRENGTEVVDMLTLVQFLRWAQKLARCTSDIVSYKL